MRISAFILLNSIIGASGKFMGVCRDDQNSLPGQSVSDFYHCGSGGCTNNHLAGVRLPPYFGKDDKLAPTDWQ
jgi:hypothetical protein